VRLCFADADRRNSNWVFLLDVFTLVSHV
jgi:hypothetical protein